MYIILYTHGNAVCTFLHEDSNIKLVHIMHNYLHTKYHNSEMERVLSRYITSLDDTLLLICSNKECPLVLTGATFFTLTCVPQYYVQG